MLRIVHATPGIVQYIERRMIIDMGQTQAPMISREGIPPASGPQWLEPGQFVAIYGGHLAPPGGCFEKPEPNAGVYPTDVCDTHVTVNGTRAGLHLVADGQINIKLPAGIPSAGETAIVVTVRGVSSQAVTVPMGKPKLTLSIAGPAYVHMPVSDRKRQAESPYIESNS